MVGSRGRWVGVVEIQGRLSRGGCIQGRLSRGGGGSGGGWVGVVGVKGMGG